MKHGGQRGFKTKQTNKQKALQVDGVPEIRPSSGCGAV